MRLPHPSEMTPERFAKQVWVEMHPIYRGALIFQSANPYFLLNHSHLHWFSDDFALYDLFNAKEVIAELEVEGFEVLISDEAEARIAWAYDFSFEPSVSIIEGLILKGFQKRGLGAMLSEERSLFNWDTGTGKTIAGICASAHRLDHEEVDHVVVWVPNHLRTEWRHKFDEFSSLGVGVVGDGWTPKRREKFYRESSDKVWVVNYDKVRTDDYELIRDTLKGKRVMFVFDEVQKLRNRKIALHKNMARLIKEMGIRHLIGLSATPVERSPEDYYNIFRIFNFEIFGLVKHFEAEYTYMNGEQDRFWKYLGFQNVDKMRLRTQFMVHSVRKTDPEIAKEFPEKDEIIVRLELSKEDRKLYKRLKDYAKQVWKDGVYTNHGFVLVEALRRACLLPETLLLMGNTGNPVGVEIARIASQFKGIENSAYCMKLEAARGLVEGIVSQDDKVLIFNRLTNAGLLKLDTHFQDFDPLLYYGELSADEKDAAYNRFKTDPLSHLLLVSDAGKEGLNIPQGGYVMHYNTPFLWTTYVQRSDRIHRIDSTRDKVTIYRFLTEDTIEERIEENMSERRETSAELGMGGDFEDDAEVINPVDMSYWLFGE